MNDTKGSLGLFVLLAGFVLSIIVQQSSVYFNYLLGYQEDYLTKQQLNLLSGSAMGVIAAKNELPVGEKILFEKELLPGKQRIILKQNVINSDDNCFSMLSVHASVRSGAEKEIQQVRYRLDENMQALAKDYVLLSPSLVQQNGADGTIMYKQANKGEVILPSISFLSGKSMVSMASITEYGWGNLPYYMSSISLAQKGNISGSPLLASKGSITVSGSTTDKITYLDNIILIANDNVTIGKNVCFNNVLIIAGKDVSIDAGCEIKGTVFAKNRITIKGPATFSKASQSIYEFRSLTLSSFST